MMNRRFFLKSATAAAMVAGAPAWSRAAELPTAALIDPALRGIGIWDLHCHVQPLGGHPSERMARLVEVADRMGVERLCIYMGGPFRADPDPEQLRQINDDVLTILKDWGHRAFGFVYLSPRHLRESLYELERCVADGPMVGVKLWIAARASQAELDPLVRRAAELKAVIFQHTWNKRTGNQPGESTPQELIELAQRHPGVPLVCGHTGGDWEWGVRSIRPHPTLYADTAGSDPTAGIVEMAVRELGAERVLYGSDVYGRSFGSQIGKVSGAAISTEQKRLILRDNLRGLLRPILQAKGMAV